MITDSWQTASIHNSKLLLVSIQILYWAKTAYPYYRLGHAQTDHGERFQQLYGPRCEDIVL